MVFISPDGLTIVNRAMPGHTFEGGQAVRIAVMSADGAWYVISHGFGNNLKAGTDSINDLEGPAIFEYMDQQMRENIERHRPYIRTERVR